MHAPKSRKLRSQPSCLPSDWSEELRSAVANILHSYWEPFEGTADRLYCEAQDAATKCRLLGSALHAQAPNRHVASMWRTWPGCIYLHLRRALQAPSIMPQQVLTTPPGESCKYLSSAFASATSHDYKIVLVMTAQVGRRHADGN